MTREYAHHTTTILQGYEIPVDVHISFDEAIGPGSMEWFLDYILPTKDIVSENGEDWIVRRGIDIADRLHWADRDDLIRQAKAADHADTITRQQENREGIYAVPAQTLAQVLAEGKDVW